MPHHTSVAGNNEEVNATREADELVRLWQELQVAQVSGDAARLAALRIHAEAQSRRPDASPEWELLAREAGRQAGHVHEARETQPTVGVAAGAGDVQYAEHEWEVDEVSAPDAATEPAEAGRRRGRGLGPLIWVVILVGYLILQLINGLTGGEGP